MTVAMGTEDSPEEKVVLFFRHVKKDLGISSTARIVNLVGRVLFHLRSGLSVQRTLVFLYPFPVLFKTLFVRNSEEKAPDSLLHLDELADLVYEEDYRSQSSLFRTEVDALKAVVVILKKLDSGLNLFSHRITKYPLVNELKQIHLEEII